MEDIDEYFEREIKSHVSEAWIDRSKTKIGYEIPMTRYFYEFNEPESIENVLERLEWLEKSIREKIDRLF